jgi:hypothetical protein
VLLKQRQVFLFHTGPVKEVVLGLLHDRAFKQQAIGNLATGDGMGMGWEEGNKCVTVCAEGGVLGCGAHSESAILCSWVGAELNILVLLWCIHYVEQWL